MLEVELDIFSGMPNPRWRLSAKQERDLYERVSADPAQVSPIDTPSERFGLGYRGLIVRRIKPDDGPWDRALAQRKNKLPNHFRIGSRPSKTDAAAWLLRTSRDADVEIVDAVHAAAARGVVLLKRSAGASPEKKVALKKPPPKAKADVHTPAKQQKRDLRSQGGIWWNCPSSYFSANAQYFNDDYHVTRNNCYCFASNVLADVRYAKPGVIGGAPATSITCGGVIDGLFADGWKTTCQTNGLTIALVIWPGVDYHFYRLVTGGPYWWWGHKPGGTPARYTDDCGHPIYQYNGVGYAPNNICRGDYVDLCGYFYQNNDTAYVA